MWGSALTAAVCALLAEFSPLDSGPYKVRPAPPPRTGASEARQAKREEGTRKQHDTQSAGKVGVGWGWGLKVRCGEALMIGPTRPTA